MKSPNTRRILQKNLIYHGRQLADGKMEQHYPMHKERLTKLNKIAIHQMSILEEQNLRILK